MKLAAIDMGTNSSRLLIVDKDGEKIVVLKRGLITTRLGEGVDRTGQLSLQAIERAVQAIKTFQTEIEKRNIEKVKMVGTSALRDVSNAQQLINRLKMETTYQMEIISGVEEAKLIYQGASQDLAGEDFVIIDIGGGSTEFIWKDKNKINYESLNLGAVRMTEKYINDNSLPLSEEEYRNLFQQVTVLLESKLGEKINRSGVIQAIGVGGTITTLAAMDLMLKEYDSRLVQNYHLKTEVINRLVGRLTKLSLQERKDLTGLQPGRADIIIAGAVILQAVFKYLNLEDITVSEHDILYGIIQEIA